MITATRSRSAPTDFAEQATLLERVLRTQLDGWRRSLAVIDQQKAAMASADAPALERATREQQHITRALSLLDQQRSRIASTLQKDLSPTSTHSLPLSQLVQRLAIEDAAQDRLLSLIAELRQVIDLAKTRNAIVSDAAATIDRHIAGIHQSLQVSHSSTRVYGRRGRLALTPHASAAVDVTS